MIRWMPLRRWWTRRRDHDTRLMAALAATRPPRAELIPIVTPHSVDLDAAFAPPRRRTR